MSQDRRRLIEVAFPLKQTSIDPVHEKNVRHFFAPHSLPKGVQ
jgi:hypothetical protein